MLQWDLGPASGFVGGRVLVPKHRTSQGTPGALGIEYTMERNWHFGRLFAGFWLPWIFLVVFLGLRRGIEIETGQ